MPVEVNHVSKVYGAQNALDDVTFSIHPGEVVGLLGPNGAGKSTLMKIITCYIPPTSGSVSVEGYDILSDSIQVRRCIGYLPENNPLYTDMYVREYLGFIAGIHNLGRNGTQRIGHIMEMTGLVQEQHKKIGALSRGYRQRVGLAQALLHDPSVLILDEPTSGLDPNQILEIRNLIKEVGKEKTVMLSTHIMQEVEAICNRAVIIDQGRIIADGHPSNLSKLIPGSVVILVEFSGHADIESLKRIKGVNEVEQVSEKTFRIRSEASTDIRPEVFQYAVRTGLTVLSLSRQEHSLEKVFQELTKKSSSP